MEFEIYNYQFSPLASDKPFFSDEAREYRDLAIHNMLYHNEKLDRILSYHNEMRYHGENMPQYFRKDGRLILINKKAYKSKPLIHNLIFGRMLFEWNGIYVMEVQNKRTDRQFGRNNKVHVIIDNRGSQQLLLIEAPKSPFKVWMRTVRNPQNTSSVQTDDIQEAFECSFKDLFKPYHLDINIRPQYSTWHFWWDLKLMYNEDLLPKSLLIKLDYPNMAADARLMKGWLKDIGIDLNTEFEIKLQGHHNQPLNLPPTPERCHPELKSLIELAAWTGNRITLGDMNGMEHNFDAETLGIRTHTAVGPIYDIVNDIKKYTESNGNADGKITLEDIGLRLTSWLNMLNPDGGPRTTVRRPKC